MHELLFQQLCLNELERYTQELEQAIDNHAQWITQINRTLICKLTIDENEIDNPTHPLCKFGRWYHSVNNPVITTLDSYRAIAPVHQKMHWIARKLLLKSHHNESITCEDYNELVEQSAALRDHIRALHNELTHNHNLTTRLMSTVFERAKEGVMITAPDTTIISVNAAFTKVTGYTEDEVIGQRLSMFHAPHQDEAVYTNMWHELNRFGQWQGEIWSRNKKGDDYLEWLSLTAVSYDNGEVSHYVAIFSDITSEKENSERLRYLAHYDQLTGLPNRILFTDRLQQAIAQSKREQRQVAVMFLDLDGFKEVNDTLGHSSGDMLLCQVAKRLTACLRATDTVARFGGDEFTIVIPELEAKDDVVRLAHKIIAEVARPYDLDGLTASLTTSIGISFYPDHGEDPNVLTQRADNAMYHAKRHGKNHHEFYGEI